MTKLRRTPLHDAFDKLTAQIAALKTENAALRERVESATIEALDYAASVCRGREKSNFESGQVTAASEAGKCAMAIEYHARNLKLTSLVDAATTALKGGDRE